MSEAEPNQEKIAAEEALRRMYENHQVDGKGEFLERLESHRMAYSSAAWFIAGRGKYEGAADFSELEAASETALVEKLSDDEGSRTIVIQRSFFSNRPWAEKIESFRQMDNYQELLDIGARLISEEGEAEINRPYEKDANPEEVKAGLYLVEVEYAHWKGERKTARVDFRVVNGTDTVGLEKNARGAITALGLHNFEMDVNSEDYPLGQKVNFKILNSDGNQVGKSSYFTLRGDGYSVPSNREKFHPAWLAEIEKYQAEKNLTPDDKFKRAMLDVIALLPDEVEGDRDLGAIKKGGVEELNMRGWLAMLKALGSDKILSKLGRSDDMLASVEKLADAWRIFRQVEGEPHQEGEELVDKIMEQVVG
ncbi:MAG: hypothetical protein HQ530_01155 [Parcubacteria group bacterium]|nr:hypothetical protein [Parcubacteria group bacterium]